MRWSGTWWTDAAGGVPRHLIADPIVGRCALPTGPIGSGEDADHQAERTTRFGDPVPLPPFGIDLETDEFGTPSDVRPHRWP